MVEAKATIELDKIGWMLYKSLQRAVKSPSSLPCSPGNTCTKSIFNVKRKGFWWILINILFLQRYIHDHHKAVRDMYSGKLLDVHLVLCIRLNLSDVSSFSEQTLTKTKTGICWSLFVLTWHEAECCDTGVWTPWITALCEQWILPHSCSKIDWNRRLQTICILAVNSKQ